MTIIATCNGYQNKINWKNTTQKYLSKAFHFEKGLCLAMFTVHKAQPYYSHVKLKISCIFPEGLNAASDLAGISAFECICIEYSLILISLYIQLTSNIHTLSKYYYW